MLLREVVSDDTPTDSARDGVMPRVMTGHAADDRAFQTTCGIGGSDGAKRKQRRQD